MQTGFKTCSISDQTSVCENEIVFRSVSEWPTTRQVTDDSGVVSAIAMLRQFTRGRRSDEILVLGRGSFYSEGCRS